MHREQLQQQHPFIIVTKGQVLSHALIPSFPRDLAVALGVVQLLLGSTSIVAASVAFVFHAYNYEIGFGYWCGAFFIVSAGAAMHAGRRPTCHTMENLMVWSVISFIFAGIELGLSMDGLNFNFNYPYYPNTYVCWWWYWRASVCYYNYPAMEAANGLMLGASGLELLICVMLIYVSARALNQAHPPAADAYEKAFELRSAPNKGCDRQYNPVAVTVVETSVQPQYLQQNVAVNELGPLPTYEVVARPAYWAKRDGITSVQSIY